MPPPRGLVLCLAKACLSRTLSNPRATFSRSFAVSSKDDNSPNTRTSLLKHLQERGLVESVTGLPGKLDTFIQSQKVTAYAGIDPTASSLHVGHLLPLMNLLHFYLNGHNSIALIGKATATVGDPSGRITERQKSASEEVTSNFDSIWWQVSIFFDSAEVYASERGYVQEQWGTRSLETNAEWLDDLKLIDFLSNIGRYIRVQQMLARQSVKLRMESQQGINFAEFTYQLLQSYDFWHLYKHSGCRLQIGGNDQYGNITAGIDLIHRLEKGSSAESEASQTIPKPPPGDFDVAYGLTVPLLTTSSGEKFGKSAGNAVWLDETLTTPFELYQFFVRLHDDVMPLYLRLFTLLPISVINSTIAQHNQEPHLRRAQHLLAKEVVHLVHGIESARKAELMTRLLFRPDQNPNDESTESSPPHDSTSLAPQKSEFSAAEIIAAFEGDHRFIALPKEEVMNEYITRVMVKGGAVKVRAEAEALAKAGGLYIGVENRRVASGKEKVGKHWLIDKEILLVRVGKSKFFIVRLV